MHPKVSICLPVYNGERYLSQAIESVLNQTFADFELLISDDGSQDNSRELVLAFAARDKRIKYWFNEQNIGLFNNYNKCLKQAQGEYIKPFAQDDVLAPEYLAKAVGVLDAEPTVVLTAVKRRVIDGFDQAVLGRDLPDSFAPGKALLGNEVVKQCLFPLANLIGEPSTVLFRGRSAGLGFDAGFKHLGDLEYWLRILLEGNFWYVPEALASFRVHEDSATSRNTRALNCASDTILFARKFSYVLESFDEDYDNFVEQSLASYAKSKRALFADAQLDITAILKADRELRDRVNAGGESTTVDQLLDELSCFRELSFYALRMVSGRTIDRSADMRVVSSNDRLINSLEFELRELHESVSWKSTRLLRETNKLICKVEEDEPEFEEILSWKSSYDNQKRYIEYLRSKIDKIKRSRSWQLTRPMRSMSLPKRV